MSAGGIFMIVLVVIFVIGVVTRGNIGGGGKVDWRNDDAEKPEK